MDPRRLLIVAVSGLVLSGCALLRPAVGTVASTPVAAGPAAAITPAEDPDAMTPGSPEPPGDVVVETEPVVGTPYLSVVNPAFAMGPAADRSAVVRPVPSLSRGRTAIAAANREASAASTSDRFVGGVQVFAWSPGRVYEVWTAPLRVTTLTLGAGETIVSKAAGDTVRWQIGDTTSGSGASQRSHVLLKPLERGLETNLVLTTNRRVYLLELRSGAPDGFNAAVAWDGEAVAQVDRSEAATVETGPVRVADPVALPQGEIDARYRITPEGRRARWTPTSVFNDGLRTFITFDADLQIDEAPALFVIAPDGEAQMVNYRQSGGLFVVDRVFDRAELRLGDRRPQIVRLQRLAGATR